jgi:hypothetical protein
MRTGAGCREALRDGRKVRVMGEGWAVDVTTGKRRLILGGGWR